MGDGILNEMAMRNKVLRQTLTLDIWVGMEGEPEEKWRMNHCKIAGTIKIYQIKAWNISNKNLKAGSTS